MGASLTTGQQGANEAELRLQIFGQGNRTPPGIEHNATVAYQDGIRFTFYMEPLPTGTSR